MIFLPRLSVRDGRGFLLGYKIISFSLVEYKNICYLCTVIRKHYDMPIVLDLFGLKFIIFTADHQPPHCHVKSSNGAAKFIIKNKVECVESTLKQVECVESTLKPKEQKLAEYVLEENLENIREAWKRIHGEF